MKNFSTRHSVHLTSAWFMAALVLLASAPSEGAAPSLGATTPRGGQRGTELEVILSGGDPLSLSDSRLTSLTDAIQKIPHVRRLRVHTRQPVVLPSRIDEGLTEWLNQLRLPVVFVLHANHANEIDSDVRAACASLRDSGVTLLNQTVLLRGVNDDASVLADLSRALFEAGVLPYYLHVLDHVRGAAHFDVPEERARLIAGQLAAQMPGYRTGRAAP